MTTDKPINPLSTNSKYHPDIDGLRAIAVLLVVVFHAFPELSGGGFVGVDVFFVISGFLITGIIVNDLDKERFSFQTFYARRIKRIYPAMLVVLSVCYSAGWLVLLPEEFASLGKHIAGGAGFVANIVLWGESGYFDVQTELKPFLHLWSLGVEEQFYFIWPLLLFAAYKEHLKLLYVLPIIFIASFALNIGGVKTDPVGTFYLPHTRFWELMVGAIVAYLLRSEFSAYRQSHFQKLTARFVAPFTLHNVSSALGLILLAVAVIFLNKKSAFPCWWAVLPTLGAALLITAGQQAWLNRKLLAHPLFVFFGLISYPLYLWHWPLLAFARILSMGNASLDIRIFSAVVSMLLAWLTYRFVELPLRFGTRQQHKTLVLSSLMVVLFVTGYSTFSAQGLPFRMADKAEYDTFFSNYHYTDTHDLLKHDRHECNFYDMKQKVLKAAIDPSCITPHSNKIVFVWGDSHAQHLNYGLRAVLPSDVSLLQAGTSGCPPTATDVSVSSALLHCNKNNRFIRDKIASLQPQLVILAQQRNHNIERYDALIAYLKKSGVKTVLLVGPVPQWNQFLYKIILRQYWNYTSDRLAVYLDKKVLATDELLKAHYKNATDVLYVSLVDGLCNAQGCLIYLNNDRKEGLITYDYGHFTLPASEYVARTMLAPIINSVLAAFKQ